MSLMRSIATVGGFTVLSRITGFARDMMIANVLGAGMVADCFFVAFKFPNLFRRLFAEGAFNSAFVPLFAAKLEGDGHDGAREFAEKAYAALAVGLAGFVAVMEIIMPWAMALFAPGFEGEKAALAVDLSRITFPYLLFISLVSLQSGVLNSLGRFAAAAGTPTLLNLTLMAALLGLNPFTATPGHALAWGTSAAGVVQFLWLIHSVRAAGMPLRWVRPHLSPEVKLLLLRVVPGAVGAGVYQVNLLVDTMLASLVSNGAVSYLYYADRVNQLPLGVVGIAIGTALLPVLSRHIRAGDHAAGLVAQNRSMEFALLLTVPSAVALAVLAVPVIAVLFERGQFGPAETEATAAALAAFALGLPAYVLNKCLTPSFFARHDTKTPVHIAIVSMLANIVINLALMKPLGHVGIALATALSAWLNVGMLAIVATKRNFFALDGRIRARAPRIVLASLLMGAALAAANWGLGPVWHAPLVVKASLLAALCVGGAVVFFALAAVTKAASLDEVKRLMRRKVA